ncbi:MAG: hypothetical protein A2W11_11305 [Ignavibacteria bacterium RBG_16_35_7]|nr:MAG: hypothetical protein A2W11_11305 [Ignavibacteria bacterium RBG_16_35_7]
MKKIAIIFVLLVVVFSSLSIKLSAQSGWFWQNPLPQGQTLKDVHVFDEHTSITVGEAGTIIKTTDGGISWVSLTGAGSDRLNSVYFIDSNTGWIVGNDGKIFKTTNGGTSWSTQISGVTDPLYSVYFINSSTGWISGEDNTILKTTNGGTNWIFLQGVFPKSVESIYFTDENNGCAAGIDYNGSNYFGVIIKTTDGGTNWTNQWSGNWLLSIHFTDSNNGWAAGAGIILKTTDGGTSWNTQITGTSYQLYSIHFSDYNFGWASGYDGSTSSGIILNTTNGGIIWNPTIIGADTVLYSIHFADLYYGWTVGDNGTILHTTNGGVSFVEGEQIDEVPAEFLLTQNYPNPFNPSTKIRYSVPKSSNVIIKVFDILGNEIETLANEEKPAGTYEINWYAANLPSGIYFYTINAGSFIETKKMILIK